MYNVYVNTAYNQVYMNNWLNYFIFSNALIYQMVFKLPTGPFWEINCLEDRSSKYS